MREIDFDDLETVSREGKVSKVKDAKCQKECDCCFVCDHGWIKQRCENFRHLYSGLRCDDA